MVSSDGGMVLYEGLEMGLKRGHGTRPEPDCYDLTLKGACTKSTGKNRYDQNSVLVIPRGTVQLICLGYH
jgi:hypothetical protein